MTEETTIVDTKPSNILDPSFFEKFTPKKFLHEDLGISEEDVTILTQSSFFNSDHDNYYLQENPDKILDNAIKNATDQVLELHSVLLYLRDSYPYLTPKGDDEFFFIHFKNQSFKELIYAYSGKGKISPKEFFCLLLLANINSRTLIHESKDRLINGEEPSDVFIDIVNRVLE